MTQLRAMNQVISLVKGCKKNAFLLHRYQLNFHLNKYQISHGAAEILFESFEKLVYVHIIFNIPSSLIIVS